MVWCMGSTRCIVDKKWSVGCQCLLILEPGYRLVGHVGEEVIVRILWQFHRVGSVVYIGCPLVGLTAEKAVELVEALVGRPAVQRSGHARLPGSGLVPLAESRGAVAIVSQHFSHWRDIAWYLTGITRECSACLDDPAHVVDVVVAATLYRSAGW